MKPHHSIFVLIPLFLAPCCLAQDVSLTGKEHPGLKDIDAWVLKFMDEHKIPGGAVAIVKSGEPIYARGFGWADREAKEPVQPDSLFRIASISKPITAVAILKLAEQGQLKLSDKVLDHLSYEPHFDTKGNSETKSETGEPKIDDRWRQITLEHCLSHSGGWDREKSYDPMFQARRMAKSLAISLPILPEHIIRYQLGQPLDFDPGERYAYSNFGYSILGRIIEKVSGQPYEQYVRQAILEPIGIQTARIGGSLLAERAPGEVKYYDVKNAKAIAVTGPGAGTEEVPISYGTWRQETLDSHGGWIVSAPDLAKFAASFDMLPGGKESRGRLLQPATINDMFAHHAAIPSTDDKTKIVAHYGLGWLLKEEALPSGGKGVVARHGGALACTASSLMHFADGVNVAIVFNLGQSADGKFLGRQIEGPLSDLVRASKF